MTESANPDRMHVTIYLIRVEFETVAGQKGPQAENVRAV
jgi:hypothetical protein